MISKLEAAEAECRSLQEKRKVVNQDKAKLHEVRHTVEVPWIWVLGVPAHTPHLWSQVHA